MKTPTASNNITHIALVMDDSGSMQPLRSAVIKVVNNQIKAWARKSREKEGNEIRISLYTLNTAIRVHLYDMDVLRVPDVAGFYHPSGGTNLIDGMYMAVSDLQKVPEIHASHQFIAFCFTDGEHNYTAANNTSAGLKALLTNLADNYTVAAFVPGAMAKTEAAGFGFPAGNIEVWDTTEKGVEEVGRKIDQGTAALMQSARSGGARSTKNLFTLATNNITKSTVAKKLDCLDPGEYTFLRISKKKDNGKVVIKDFVESWNLPFRQGANYYHLTPDRKPEKVQAGKQICLREKKTGKVFTGSAARQLLGLPDYEVTVPAAAHPDYEIYIQSTSNNRHLVPGTELLVMN